MYVIEVETIASQKPKHSVGFRNDIDDVLGPFYIIIHQDTQTAWCGGRVYKLLV
jgi:hypothetical protein